MLSEDYDDYFIPENKWEMNTIQFPRLLAEIRAIGLTKLQYADLEESMDCSRNSLDELFERAEAEWNLLKEPPVKKKRIIPTRKK